MAHPQIIMIIMKESSLLWPAMTDCNNRLLYWRYHHCCHYHHRYRRRRCCCCCCWCWWWLELMKFSPTLMSFFEFFQLPDEDYVSKALVFLIVLYVSSYRWVYFSRAALFCQPHQRLFTHSYNYDLLFKFNSLSFSAHLPFHSTLCECARARGCVRMCECFELYTHVVGFSVFLFLLFVCLFVCLFACFLLTVSYLEP